MSAQVGMHVNNKNLMEPFCHQDFIEFCLCIESSRTLSRHQNGGKGGGANSQVN